MKLKVLAVLLLLVAGAAAQHTEVTLEDSQTNPPISGDKTFTGTVNLNGPVNIGGAAQVNGNLQVNGTLLVPYLSANGMAVPVELYGAVGDWNGSTGTDNTAAIQACLDALTTGSCLLQAKSYKTTAALTITKSSVGLGGVAAGSPAPGDYPTPSPSQIVSTCASCDIIDVSGTSAANAIAFNRFKDITLSRSVSPTGTAKGLSLVFADSPIIDGVTSQDSISDFYFRGVNATSAAQRIQNSFAIWGVNGVAEPLGSMYGFQIDSTDGSTNNSIYFQNTGVVSNFAHNGTSTTYGYQTNGSQIHDLYCYQCNASNVDYGIYVNSSSFVFGNSSDIHLLDSKLDGCAISCVYATGIGGSVSVTGGWFYRAGAATTPTIDLENAANVSVLGSTLYFPGGTGGGILAHGGNSIQVVGTKMPGLNVGTAITFNTILNGVISANDMGGVIATSIISLIASTNIAVSSNTLSGTATNGILIDAASSAISGLETNNCGGSGGTVTTCVNDQSGVNSILAVVPIAFIKPLTFATLPTCDGSVGRKGKMVPITDSNTAVFNANITAGGAGNFVIALCNGTNWVAH